MTRHLQVNAIKPRVQYRADGVRCEFLFPFAIFADTNLEVYLESEKVMSGFTVRGIGESEGGSITFAVPPPSGVKVTLRRRMVIQRTTDFQESGPFRARVLNDELDYLTATIQQLETEIERSIRLAPADADVATILPEAAQRAGRAMAFDSNGDLTALLPSEFMNVDGIGWRSLDDVPEGTAVRRFSNAEKAKLAGIEPGAQVNAPLVSPQEKALANEPSLRSFSPKDVADMVAIHAPVYDHAVDSVHGRTGAVVAQTGDYSAEQITDTAAKVMMMAAERSKLDGIEMGAQVNPPRLSASEKSSATSTSVRGFAPVDVSDMVAALSPAAPVTSVAGRTGTITLTKTDVGLGNVTNDAQIRADLGYPTKTIPASGDKLIIKDQTDGQPKVIDWNQLPSGGGSVNSVHGRTGTVVAQAGDYAADQIADTATKVLMTAAERTKLTGIATGAQVNPIRVTAAEKAAPTSITVRGFAPVDVRDMVTALAPAALVSSVAGRTGAVVLTKADVGLASVSNDPQLRADLGYAAKTIPASGDKLIIKDQTDGQPKTIDWNQLPTGSVTSVHGRTGPVVAQAGDYTAEQIADTAAKVLMTAAERTKVAGIEAGAQVNPPSVTDAEKATPSQATSYRSFSPKDIADLIAALAVTSVNSIDGGSATTVFTGAAA